MYLPPHFEERDPARIATLMREHALGSLVVSSTTGLVANHLPLELVEGAPRLLRGHVARANPLHRSVPQGTAAIAIFQGPQAYVSPSWYPSKQADGRVVPTWNYLVVHVHGRLRFIEEREWLRALVSRLTDAHEARNGSSWKITDAPAEYIDRMLAAIVGIEIEIERIDAKWKNSQNRSEADREAVALRLGPLGFS